MVEIDADEESEYVRHAHSPDQPTEAQIQEHRENGHHPYRTWCEHCVQGRGRGGPHKSTKSVAPRPIIGIDYFFITSKGVKKSNELHADSANDVDSEPETEAHEDQYVSAEGGMSDSQVETARADGKIVKCILIRDFKSKVVFAHVAQQKGNDAESWVANLVAGDLTWF
jgi:hypothetical protein